MSNHVDVEYWWGQQGHLALNLFGDGVTGESRQGECYVNWAPMHGQPHMKDLFPEGRHDKDRFRFTVDKKAMAYPVPLAKESDDTKTIAGIDDETPFGLDVQGMFAWWQVFKETQSADWSLARRNCSSVVAKCLIAGGATAFVRQPVSPVWTPKNVFEWATDIAAAIDERNNKARELVREAVGPGPARRDTSNDLREVWTVEEFKKESDAGKFSHRYAAMQRIDAALAKFWVALSLDDPEDKVAAVGAVMDAIHEQMVERPNSVRRNAIIALGQQLLKFLKDFKAANRDVFRERGNTDAARLPLPNEVVELGLTEEFLENAYFGDRADCHNEYLGDPAYRAYCTKHKIELKPIAQKRLLL